MRSIQKGAEPAVLAHARRTVVMGGAVITGDDWPPAGPGVTQTIRDALLVEQAGLCAYCCGQIRTDAEGHVPAADRAHPQRGGMSIEHWLPRHGYPGDTPAQVVQCGLHALDWSNLLGVCVGVSFGVEDERESHCDQSRGNRRLNIHPARDKNLVERFAYNPATGRMVASNPADTAATDDIAVLCLNQPRLCANRQAAIGEVRRRLRQDDSPATLRRLWRIATVPSGGRLPPYAPAVERYLEKKLRVHGVRP